MKKFKQRSFQAEDAESCLYLFEKWLNGDPQDLGFDMLGRPLCLLVSQPPTLGAFLDGYCWQMTVVYMLPEENMK